MRRPKSAGHLQAECEAQRVSRSDVARHTQYEGIASQGTLRSSTSVSKIATAASVNRVTVPTSFPRPPTVTDALGD